VYRVVVTHWVHGHLGGYAADVFAMEDWDHAVNEPLFLAGPAG
jgi:hypothetical protein